MTLTPSIFFADAHSTDHTKMGESRQVFFPTAQQVNLPACSSYGLVNAERQAGKL